MTFIDKLKDEANLVKFVYDNVHSGFNAFWASFGMKPLDMLLSSATGLSLYSADHMAVGTYIGSFFTRRDGAYTLKTLWKTLLAVSAFTISWEYAFEGSFDFSLGSLDTLIDISSNTVGAFVIGPGIEGIKKLIPYFNELN